MSAQRRSPAGSPVRLNKEMSFALLGRLDLFSLHMAKQALGKGLGALIKKPTSKGASTKAGGKKSSTQSRRSSSREEVDPSAKVQEAPISDVVRSPMQPRGEIPASDLEELVESIRAHGVIQPLIVRLVRGKLELIAGERRWRACQKLELETVPVIVRKATDREVLEMALVENLQRQDLNAIEEANGYVKLAKEFGLKQDEIARRVGKSRAAVANSMRLLDLHKDIQRFVADGLISVGHAKAILGLKVKREQREVADQVMKRRLTVRATEKLVQTRQSSESEGRSAKSGREQDPETVAMVRALTSRLREHFTTHVSISHSSKKGRIELEYYGNDDLQRLLELLGISTEDL